MRRISLYHLETLLWISRLGTFGAAAERLNTTQPAVSARIREMENQIGFRLFERAGRNMALTVRGRDLVRECEPLWASIERTFLQSGRFEGASGIVRIGAGEIAAATCLPPFFASLKADMPRVTFEVEIDLSHGLLQKLLGATCDLVFLAGPVASPNIETAPIGAVDLVWIGSPSLAHDRGLDSASPVLWLLHRHSPIHRVARTSLEEAGHGAATINSCNNVRSLIDIVLAGGGISFVPEIMARDHLQSGALVRLRPDLDRAIPFHAAIRAQERDPLVRDIFERAATLSMARVSPDP
ncbi:MAG: LysR family transcriptional regulator [Pseudomonadota bacterium]